jgi:hypothetical protein
MYAGVYASQKHWIGTCQVPFDDVTNDFDWSFEE